MSAKHHINKPPPANLPTNSNLLNVSTLTEFYSAAPYRSFSIKYVVEGSELYSVNGNKYQVQSKQYLLANRLSEGYVLVDSKKPVKGICIDVSPDVLTEVVSSHLRPYATDIDPALGSFFGSELFLENKYNAHQTSLGKLLKEAEPLLLNNGFNVAQPSKEFYYTLCEKIVDDHVSVFRQLQKVRAVKLETRKIIMRKLLVGKNIMDDCFVQPTNITEVAAGCGISEYHFFRLFKSTFGISPNQYLIQKRMQHAQKLLTKGNQNLTELAALCGYTDIFSFSKAFKKHFGCAPSLVRQKNSRI